MVRCPHFSFSPVQRCRLCPGSSTTSWVSMLCSPPDPLSLANVSVQPGQEPQELRVSWVESGGGRDHLVQLSVAESLSIIRNVSVPRGVTQLALQGLVPGSRYRVEIISQAGPHRISSQTAIGYTGTAQLPCSHPLCGCPHSPAPSSIPTLDQCCPAQACPSDAVSLPQSLCLLVPCLPAPSAQPRLWLCTGRLLLATGMDTCSACSRRALLHGQGTWKQGRTAPMSLWHSWKQGRATL